MKLSYIIICSFLFQTAFALNITFDGTERIQTSPTHQTAVLKIKIAPKTQKKIKTKLLSLIQKPTRLPMSIHTKQLGMNNVPVLDQGVHGTCVTFAISAALDAIIGESDQISQLCSLQLGEYLEKNAYAVSGWEGSWANNVLSQFMTFGYISNQTQINHGCGDAKEYPINNVQPQGDIDVPTYHAYAEPSFEQVHIEYSALLDINQRLYDDENTYILLNKVKNALDAGDRLSLGVALADLQLGIAGAIGNHHVNNDSWIITPEISQDVQNGTANYGMHEMLITGYDDNAVAKDASGRVHYGLLTLRNSWGSTSGDNGDFYMSYDYFKAFALETYRIRKLPDDTNLN